MQDLIELINIVTKQKVSQIEIITENAHMSNKARILLEGVRDGTIKNDEDAMLLMYNKTNKEAYKKVKSRLKEKLLNTLFFIDLKKYRKSEIPREHFKSYKKFSQLKMLADEGNYAISARMAKKLLVKTERHEIRDLTILLCKHLEEFHLVWERNLKLANIYSEKIELTSIILEKERQLMKLWANLATTLMTNRGEKKEYHDIKIDEQLKRLSQTQSDHLGFMFNYRLYTSKIFYAWLCKDYINQRGICNESLKYLKPHFNSRPVPYVLTSTYKAIAELNLKDYEASDNTLQNILDQHDLTKGKLHWLNIYNYLFLIKMIKKEYSKAAKLVAEVTGLKNFKKLNEKWRQPWLIKETYINILIKIGKIKNEDLEGVKMRPFRINKFVNDVPLYFKDKRGTNIAILIAQFIFLLADNKTDKLFERLDGLNQYCHRYLRNDATYRSNCFIKMLMKIPTASFHPIRVRNHTKDLHKKLQNAPMTISEQSYEVEIIPYEDLWDLVLGILEDKKG